MSEIQFDDVTPASYAYLADNRRTFMVQQGGLLTRLHYSGVTQTTIEDFIANEVPKLKPVADELKVIRSVESKSLSLVLDDQVITYKLTGIEEAGLDDFINSLEKKPELSVIPDIPYPIIKYGRTDNGINVTVLVKGYQCVYRSKLIDSKMAVRIYLPPMWLTVLMTPALMYTGARLVVVPQQTMRAKDAMLKRWMLPNVFGNGNICMGQTRFVGDSAGGEPTMGSVIDSVLNRVFNSDWNLDLFEGVMSYEGLDDINPGRKEYYDKLKKHKGGSTCELLDILRVLELPDGWQRLSYRPFNGTAAEFLSEEGLAR